MNLNPLKSALSQKSVQQPELFLSLPDVDFAPQAAISLPANIAAHFPHLNQKPILKLLPHKGKKSMPLKVGVVFSGGQAPGGHNVLWGIYDALKKMNPKSKLLGFLGGPSGLLKGNFKEITSELLNDYRNLGGFDMIGSGRTKIAKREQLEKALKTCKTMQLDGFIIIGGDDSNTNAAVLAEYFLKNNCSTCVCGVPKTIDGDLQNSHVEISFGFDSACKLYSELIGNISTDILSAKKYYHFIKLMGRSASHIALECALQTHPNLVFIGEEVEAKNLCLNDLVDEIVELILERAAKGKNYGMILIPEGLIDFVPSFKKLNAHLNDLLASQDFNSPTEICQQLPDYLQKFFKSLPSNIQEQLLLDRDPHGNIQLAKIDTHRMLIAMVKDRLEKTQNKQGAVELNEQSHYFGYEGRCVHPTCFDADYTYALGCCSAQLVRGKHTGYMACIKNLMMKAKHWEVYGLPIASLLNIEKRHGKEKPVIKKALVNLDGPHYKYYLQEKENWRLNDCYNSPGPIQYFGPEKVSECRNYLLNTLSKNS